MRTTLTLDDDVAARLERVMEKRRQTLKAVVNDALRAGLQALDKARPALLAFVRLACNPAVVPAALRPAIAWQYVEEWLALDNVWIPEPGPRHATILGGFFGLSQMTGRLVPDAHLAALAVEHGLTLCSTDGDFAKFPGLDWLNPLAA